MKKQILMRLWLIAFCALTSVFASAQFCVYYGGKEVFAMPSALPDSVTFHMNYQTVGGSVPARLPRAAISLLGARRHLRVHTLGETTDT